MQTVTLHAKRESGGDAGRRPGGAAAFVRRHAREARTSPGAEKADHKTPSLAH